MSDEDHLIPIPNIALESIRKSAKTIIKYKEWQLTEDLGRSPTPAELEEITSTEIKILHTIEALKRNAIRKNTIPDSLLVQIFLAKIRA